MPGLNMVVSFEKGIKMPGLEKLRRFMMWDKNTEYKIITKKKNLFIGYSKHKSYPVKVWKKGNNLVILEGKIYNKNENELKKELLGSQKLISGKWIKETDGDFLIVFLNRKEIKIIGDILGRLPAYYFSKNGIFAFSREIKFITLFMENIQLDKIGMAQYILFGYPLGKRTILEDVYRLPPSFFIKINLENGKTEIKQLWSHCFEEKEYVDLEEAKEVFIEACRNRANEKNVISLSGGLDSRLVVAGMVKAGIKPVAVTRLGAQSVREAEIAQEICKMLGIKWFSVPVTESLKDMKKIIEIKDGMVYTGWCYMLPFYKAIKKAAGENVTLFTGEGGDKIFPRISPVLSLKDVKNLKNFILSNHSIMEIKTVAKLLNLDIKTIEDDIEKTIEMYPEKNMNAKYVHFVIFERGFKWLFEGEDRHRFFFWSVTPFYSFPVFERMMKIEDRRKNGYRLYENFLNKLHPSLLTINNAKWGFPLSSPKKEGVWLREEIFSLLPFAFKNFLRRKIKKEEKMENDIIKFTHSLIERSSIVSEVFEKELLKEILIKCKKRTFHFLFSLIYYINKLEEMQ